ncbi:hypothetical protein HDU99_006062 [Rhizoclosmatium hyalinum]|nr:hypothetical protein HDU99_006062 [Rhizoclosmatium hyalinum]
MFLKLVAKDRVRSWTTITWAIPLIVFSSYGLYQRLVLGKERKPTPDLYAPFTPVTPPIEAESKEESQTVGRFELAKRPFEK